jgi:hypothetical protein
MLMPRVALCILNEGYVLDLRWCKRDLSQVALFAPVPLFGGKMLSEITLAEDVPMTGIYLVHHYAHTPDGLVLNITVGQQSFGTFRKLTRVTGGRLFTMGRICFPAVAAASVLSQQVCGIADSEQADYG